MSAARYSTGRRESIKNLTFAPATNAASQSHSCQPTSHRRRSQRRWEINTIALSDRAELPLTCHGGKGGCRNRVNALGCSDCWVRWCQAKSCTGALVCAPAPLTCSYVHHAWRQKTISFSILHFPKKRCPDIKNSWETRGSIPIMPFFQPHFGRPGPPNSRNHRKNHVFGLRFSDKVQDWRMGPGNVRSQFPRLPVELSQQLITWSSGRSSQHAVAEAVLIFPSVFSPPL